MEIVFYTSIAIIIAGALRVFVPEAMWSLTKLGNDVSGVKSNKNERWKIFNRFTGFVLLFLGVILLGFSIWASMEQQKSRKVKTDINEEVRVDLDELLPEIMKDSEFE